MGGTDEPANIVRLTAEEHFVAHQLLVKMHPSNHKLLWALSAMTNATGRQQRSQNKRYGWLRRRFAKMVGDRSRGKKASAETKAKQSAARIGKPLGPFSTEHRQRLSASAKGKTKSEAHRESLRKAHTGRQRPPRSEEWKRNHAEALRRVANTRDLSFTQSPEYRAKQAARMKEIWAERKAAKLKG